MKKRWPLNLKYADPFNNHLRWTVLVCYAIGSVSAALSPAGLAISAMMFVFVWMAVDLLRDNAYVFEHEYWRIKTGKGPEEAAKPDYTPPPTTPPGGET